MINHAKLRGPAGQQSSPGGNTPLPRKWTAALLGYTLFWRLMQHWIRSTILDTKENAFALPFVDSTLPK
jgi:hypothetical protein